MSIPQLCSFHPEPGSGFGLREGQARTADRSVPPGGAQGPQIDWAHIRNLAERTKGPELVVTSAVGDDIPLDEMPELEDVVRQA